MRVEVIGNIVHDPEVKASANGNNYLSFDICDRTAGKDKKVYVKVALFGKRIDFFQQYAVKGKAVIASGHLEGRVYAAKDGEQKIAYSIMADRCDLLPRDFSDDEQNYIRNKDDIQRANNARNSSSARNDDLEEDFIPF